MTPLFGYGTFRHAAWRGAILGAAYSAEPATLRGWRRTVTQSGYLSLAGDAHATVSGVLVALDDIGWTIADAWEEVPRYARVAVSVVAAHGSCAAIAYVAAPETHDSVAAHVVESDRFALLDDADVDAAIARFVPQMRALRAAAVSRP